MTKNMGPLDRALRFLIALVIGSFLVAGTLTGVVAMRTPPSPAVCAA